jgi:zinc transporter, ZIP family
VDGGTLFWIIVPGLATGIGGLVLLVFRNPSDLTLDSLLGFTAGVMLAATSFSLLVPALERGSLLEVLAGLLAGAVTIAVLDSAIPHAHARFRERGRQPADERAEHQAALLLSALTIHNVPEGMAVGVAFAAGGDELGVPLAIAIGVQNIPEGFAAAAPLLRAGVGVGVAAAVAAATGIVEPPMAALAYLALDLVDALLPLGLSFAAGAMLFVIVDELIPESHGRGNERAASVALIAGFAVMLALDNAFG